MLVAFSWLVVVDWIEVDCVIRYLRCRNLHTIRWGAMKEKVGYLALAGVAQWTEHWPVNQRAISLIPSQDTCLGCRPGQVPSRGRVRDYHTLMFLSLSVSLPSPLSKIHK